MESNTIECAAVSEGKPVARVTAAGGTFPYGVSAVTCAAKDKAGNVGAPVTFTVRVDCLSGFSFQNGACRGERGLREKSTGSGTYYLCLRECADQNTTPFSPQNRTPAQHYPPPPALSRTPDNDECHIGGGSVCSPDANCANNANGEGTYACACKTGFDGDGTTCKSELGVALRGVVGVGLRWCCRGALCARPAC
jgi:hypothetical protein